MSVYSENHCESYSLPYYTGSYKKQSTQLHGFHSANHGERMKSLRLRSIRFSEFSARCTENETLIDELGIAAFHKVPSFPKYAARLLQKVWIKG